MQTKTVLCIIAFVCLPIISCNTINPVPDTNFNISVADVTCSQVWLQISADPGSNIILKKDDWQIENIRLAGKDTIVVDKYGSPNKTYTYEAIISRKEKNESRKITVTTMDTTSHAIKWQTFLFGNRTSRINDIAIVNENDIWAVGEIFTTDSLGNNDYESYNAVHWDGSKWNLLRILVRDFGTLKGYYTLNNVCAISKNDVWFSSSADLIKWDGKKFESKAFFMLSAPFEWQINKIWGTDDENIYCAGNNGALFHYKGKSWDKLETNTNSDLLDIYGEKDNIFIAGYSNSKPSVLLRLKDGIARKIIEYNTPYIRNYGRISGAIFSIWVKGIKLYTLTDFNIYLSGLDTKGNGSEIWIGEPQHFPGLSVRGNEINDIVTCGTSGGLMHYNGISWHEYNELIDMRDNLYKVDVKGNTIAAAGDRYNNGVERYGLIQIGYH